MFFRKQCWYLVSERTLGLMNALKYHWCKTSLFLSQTVLKHVVSKDFIFKKSVQGTCSVTCHARMKKSMALFHIKIFSCHVTVATFKKNFNMWVTSGSCVGHIRIVLWVIGSNGSTGVTHFQPCYICSLLCSVASYSVSIKYSLTVL